MKATPPGRGSPARIEYLRVRNFRALKEVEFKYLTPLTVLLGPNGSGKSTVFDVFAFLAECFEFNLRRAWDKRGRARELKTRGADGPVLIEIKYREQRKSPLITYHLAVDERDGVPLVIEEWLQWKRGRYGRPFRFLDYREGMGQAIRGELPDEQDKTIEFPLSASDLLAVNALGQFAEHPRVAALRQFITGWHVYPTHSRTRNSLWDMILNLSVTVSRHFVHSCGIRRRKKSKMALTKWPKLAGTCCGSRRGA